MVGNEIKKANRRHCRQHYLAWFTIGGYHSIRRSCHLWVPVRLDDRRRKSRLHCLRSISRRYLPWSRIISRWFPDDPEQWRTNCLPPWEQSASCNYMVGNCSINEVIIPNHQLHSCPWFNCHYGGEKRLLRWSTRRWTRRKQPNIYLSSIQSSRRNWPQPDDHLRNQHLWSWSMRIHQMGRLP